MSIQRREQLLRLYHLALAREGEDRDMFLRDACAGDEDLRHEVEALLERDPPSDFLGVSAVVPESVLAGVGAGGTMTGQQIGPYRVDVKLGSGGMGDVFRAHDTKLRRDVAIKMLPPVFSQDRERLARFEREARVLATLNHPHIGAIYGLEQANGMPALVLELVDGETLAERIARRNKAAGAGLSIEEALSCARHIADALEAAHEKGIVHRDLKPGNIKITPDGTLKVLDFGLAKATADVDARSDGSVVATSDTATRTGVVMGTAAYMSPEQANGKKVDKRTDIWAFGCVLYEMLTGRAAFAKTTGAETIGAVLYRDPAWDALPSDTPGDVRIVLERCLQKDPMNRLRDIGDVRLALTGAFSPRVASDAIAPTSLPAVGVSRALWSRAAPVLVSLLIGGLVTAVAMRRNAAERPAQVTALSIGTRGEAELYVDGNSQELAITPDGSRIVYVGDGGRRIFMRALDQVEPIAIAAGSLLMNPFISPDGQWVGYGEGFGVLKKVPISGGPAVTITSARVTRFGLLRGAVWLADNTIVFGGHGRATGLLRVSADAGTPQALTTPDANRNEFDHYWPQVLPDGRGVLYTVLARDLGVAKIAVFDLQTNTSTDVLTGGSQAMYLRSGHLVYIAGGALWAVPFDADRRIIKGAAVMVLKQLASTRSGTGNFAISATGTLAYAHTSGYDPFARTLSWIDRNGKLESLDAHQQPYTQPRISHDGRRIVYVTGTVPDNNVWVLDISRSAPTRLRTEAATDQNPSWGADDRSVLFASNRGGGAQQIWRHAADGTGKPEFLADGVSPVVTPDGTQLIFSLTSSPGDNDIMQMALDGSRRQETLVKTPGNEPFAEVSPSGRWLAYQSNASGQEEVWVRPYPNTESGRWLVSTNGGQTPLWSRDGRELFYMAPDGALMGVQVKDTGSAWTATSPSKTLEPGYWSSDVLIGRQYDVSPDGKRFLVVTPPKDPGDPPELIVMQHWGEELKTKLPSK
jgi:eukaryotic-like serine/threonine-protein kinase